MIEFLRDIDPSKVEKWLNESIRPLLTKDVSNYAKGRLRAWLGDEPMLFTPFNIKPGIKVPEKLLSRLQDLLGWTFDFCLATYSGDDSPIGISPHRDAGYAGNEAYSWNISGECQFDYWQDRGGDERSKTSLFLSPGSVCRFDCKHIHAASPSAGRWNLNFWKRKANGLQKFRKPEEL